MKWLWQRWNSEGPGIPKDAPKKRGLALFAQIVGREFWELFKLNLLIVLFSLPVVTIPATHAAATRICISMSRDENVYLFRDFLEALRALAWPATLWGFAFAGCLTLCGYAAFIYGQLALTSLVYAIPFALALAACLLLGMVAAHLFVLLARQSLPAWTLLRLAFMATLVRPLPVLGAFAFIAALWLAHIVFYPVSVFMPAVFNFSLGTLAVTFAVLKATDFVLQLPGQGPGGITEDFADAHMRRR